MNTTRSDEFRVEFTASIALSLGLLLLPIAGCGSKKKVEYGPQNTQLTSSSEVESARRAPLLSSDLDNSLDQVVNWNQTVDREVRHLAAFLNDSIRENEVRSEFPASGLKYAGIVRADATPTLTGEGIKVSRWRRGSNSPEFVNDGLKQLVENLYAPWQSSSSFQTELQAHQITREQDVLSVSVVAKIIGQLDESTKLEATSIWTTRWKIQSDRIAEIQLEKIIVNAHEETRFTASPGPLFKDATRIILKNQDCLPEQLNHGLDDWAKWISGLNVIGDTGFAIGDPNNDGLEDIYVCQPHGLPNLMLVQNSDGTAMSVGSQTGTNLLDDSRAALFVDLDNDGDEDLVISTSRELILLSNSSDGQFQLEHRLLQGFDGGSISAADYDNDGDVDLFVCKYLSSENDNDFFPNPSSYNNAINGGRDVLLRNDEGWQFTDVTSSSGLDQGNHRFTRCAIWCDFDNDGDQDLFTVNEFSENRLFENTAGRFSTVENFNVDNQASSARCASVGDFNIDGKFDFFVTSSGLREARQLNQESGPNQSSFQNGLLESLSGENYVYHSSLQEKSFTQYRLPAPVYDSQLTNGSTNIDLNNDGFEDIILTNGKLTRRLGSSDPTLETHWLQHGFSSQSFSDVSVQPEDERFASITRALADELRLGKSFGEQQRNVCLLGIGKPGFANFSSIAGVDFADDDARAIATLDWDHDGDLDIVMTARTAPRLRILINQLKSENQFVSFHLNGVESNRDAIGARVELFLTGKEVPLVKSVTAGSGTFSQSSKRLHFGIPSDAKVTKATIHWPSGTTQTFTDVTEGSRYQVHEGNDRLIEQPRRRFSLQLLDDAPPVASQPLDFEKSVLHPPHGIPSLQFQGENRDWFKLENVDRMPILVVFVDGSPASIQLMNELDRESSEFSDVIDVVGIRIDGKELDSAAHFTSMESLVEQTEFPFRYGAASQSMVDKMKRLYGEWFSHQALPPAPFGWLIDRDGRVRIVYHSGKIVPNHVQRHLTFVEGGLSQSAKQVAPFEGRWVCSTPAQNYSRLVKRFEDLGYADDQKKFAILNHAYLANKESQRAAELVAQGDPIAAEKAFEEALELEPDCGITCIAYGNFLLQQFENEQSSEARRSLLDDAERLFERALRLEPSSAQAVLGRAEVDKNRSRVDDAITLLRKHLKINPNQWEVHAALGRLYYEKRRYVEATSHLQTAFKKRPTLPFLAGDLGFLHLHGGLYKEARYYLQSACELQPNSPKLQQNLAEVEFWTNHFEPSITILRKFNKLGVDSDTSKLLLAWQLASCPDRSLRDGKESLRIALGLVKSEPRSTTRHEICAAAYAELGDFENALAMQRKAADLMQTESSTVSYTEDQQFGLLERLQLYQQNQPCRSNANDDIPIRQPGT